MFLLANDIAIMIDGKHHSRCKLEDVFEHRHWRRHSQEKKKVIHRGWIDVTLHCFGFSSNALISEANKNLPVDRRKIERLYSDPGLVRSGACCWCCCPIEAMAQSQTSSSCPTVNLHSSYPWTITSVSECVVRKV